LKASRLEKKQTLFIANISVFAALTVITDLILESPLPYSGVWLSWVFIMEPITGIILNPYTSFFATMLGVMVGHAIRYRGIHEFIFTLGAPFGSVVSSLMFRQKWKLVFMYYITLLGVYFFTPISWSLPLFGMWDVYTAFVCLLVVISIIIKKVEFWKLYLRYSPQVVALCTFIGLEADVLFRIFILIPCQTYWLFYGWNVETLQAIWASGAVETPTKVGLSMLVSAIVIPPIVKALQKSGLVEEAK